MIDYEEAKRLVDEAKAKGLITGDDRVRSVKAVVRRKSESEKHPSVFKIPCPSCGAHIGESCYPTAGLTDDVPVHASRLAAAENCTS